MNWIYDWPIESGFYWFFGWCFRNRDRAPELHFVKVRKISNGMCYITNGHFLYKAEGAEGVWQLVKLPILPTMPLKLEKEKDRESKSLVDSTILARDAIAKVKENEQT